MQTEIGRQLLPSAFGRDTAVPVIIEPVDHGPGITGQIPHFLHGRIEQDIKRFRLPQTRERTLRIRDTARRLHRITGRHAFDDGEIAVPVHDRVKSADPLASSGW